ncbi:MAG: fibronectin type III domain-containing protein [Chitinophagaceae bacterium]|nr:fibronectin type III domain-containing protein [Chitinophagaceae bacterium]
MNQSVRNFLAGVFSLFLLFSGVSSAQAQVFNPNDPVVIYNPASPPAQPANGQVGKWVKTNRLSWNTDEYKAYIYKGMAFRLKYPKNYVPGNGKKYPLFIFFHGVGERGTIYDNEYQLYHGGKTIMNAVTSGKYDGFLLYPQSSTAAGTFTTGHKNNIRDLIVNFLIPQVQVDPFRIQVNGLSGGGDASWSFFFDNPKLVSAALPMSNVSVGSVGELIQNKYTPVWLFQGALDKKPQPGSARSVNRSAIAAGANFRYTEYPDKGHDTWNSAWKEADFFPYLMRAHKANPWPLFGRTSFCVGEPINVKMGVTAGFDGYEWRKNGDLIAGATTNEITVTSIGVYDCRIKNGTEWSVWSPIPVEIKNNSQNVSPNITLGALGSKVLPSPDGKTTVELVMPEGFYGYSWEKIGATGNPVSTSFAYQAGPGNYRARVSESAVCTRGFSPTFTVVDANGPNKPDPVANLIVNKQSKSSLKLDWINNPNAVYPATNYEVYQATKAGGPYVFVGITEGTELTFTKEALTPGVKYYYVVRAVNNTGASALSNEASATTDADYTPPSAPSNLKVVGTSTNSVSLTWDESEDDVGLDHYDIYVNGVKAYYTSESGYTVFNLEPNLLYTFTIKAVDISANESAPSNQVTAQTALKGLRYKYYLGTWDNLPDFNKIYPTKTGYVPNINIDNSLQAESFAYMWEGEIRIPAAGTYTFRTNSDDGSRLYIGTPYSASVTPLVENDGVHTARNRDGSITFDTPGKYKFIVTYFQKVSTKSITVSWKVPQSNSFVPIPDNVFVEEAPPPGGTVPNKPTGVTALTQSYNKIKLNWTDNSNNETSFEVFRSENAIDDFTTIAVLPSNTTTYTDTTALPATKYYYKVRAINQYGQSAFDKSGRGVDYSYYETGTLSALPQFNNLIPAKTGRSPIFTLGMEDRSDNFAVKFDGTITIPAAGTYTFYLTSDDGSKLYIGGYNEANLVVNHDGGHSSSEKSGTKTFSGGTYPTTVPITVTFFEIGGSEVLSVSYKGPNSTGISKQVIPVNVLGEEPVSATTQAAPPPPAAPTSLDAFTFNSSIIKLVWINNAGANATKYELYRSYLNKDNFVLYTSLPGTAASFTDTGLYANSMFFYKVRAVGVGGESDFSNEDSARTFGIVPVLTTIENQYMRYGTQLQVPVSASNGTSEAISLTVTNLPPFGTFAPTGNGKGIITFTSTGAGDQGAYGGIVVKAANTQGDTALTSFNLVINDNYVPKIQVIPDVTVNEKQTVQISVSATDQDPGDMLLWTFLNLPSFVSVSDTNRVAQLVISPNYSQAGTYKVTAKVEDGRNGKDTLSFTIKVNATAISTDKVYINFNDGSADVPNPLPGSKWNNTNKSPSVNSSFTNLKNDKGVATTIGLKILTSGMSSASNGANTGNNSGVVPDSVMRSQYRIASGIKNFQISGLKETTRYNFIFFNSSNLKNRDISTEYTINGVSVSLNAADNSQNTVTISGILPASDGTITFSAAKGSGNTYTYAFMNAMIIEAELMDSSAPAKPKDVIASFEDDVVKLSWTNVAHNATTYEVYRSNNLMGPFVLLNPGVINSQLDSYIDNTVVGNKTYYYIVRAKNDFGGTNTQTLKVVIPNKAPAFTSPNDIFVKAGLTTNVNVKAVDDAGDNITLSASGLPSFVTFTDNGSGNGVFHITPSQYNKGVFHGITVTAADNSGSNSSQNVSIYVTDQSTSAIYVNFNIDNPVDGVWNNFSKAPAAGASITALKNDLGAITTTGVTLLDAWQPVANLTGAVSGDNTGAYRDDVLKTLFSESSGNTKRIKITGLSTDPAKRYSLKFVAGVNATGNRNTTFAAGGKTVSVNASYNVANVVQINDLTPDASGSIEFTAIRTWGATGVYINALVIEQYNASATLAAPENLKGNGTAKDSIRLNWINKVDNASTEIYRSTSMNGSYQLVATVAPGLTSYVNGGLQSNTEYFYKIRHAQGGNFYPYGNTIAASTLAYSIYINFNRDDPASLPWNNTNAAPELGATYQNFYNDRNNYSGVDMEVMYGFSGDNPFGANTGDNSGVLPDNVMRSTWWTDVGQDGQLKFSGLSQNMSYSFTFFASRATTVERVVNYVINGRVVKLKANNNSTDIVTMENVRADADGVIVLTIVGEGLSYGYIGGMIISAAKRPSDPSEGQSGEVFRTTTGRGNGEEAQASLNPAETSDRLSSKVNAYPNPFTDDVILKFSLQKDVPKMLVRIMDSKGKVMLVKEFSKLNKGEWNLPLGLNGSYFAPGIYFMQVEGISGERIPPIKIMKTR